MRTLFVRPSCRGKGIGRKLVEASLNEARKLGYAYVRLDTLSFMHGALGLYRSLGFYDVSPYRDMPASLKQHIRFLEIKLP
jgi:ribosomal protein S18 acetylase RimI-like enzyme